MEQILVVASGDTLPLSHLGLLRKKKKKSEVAFTAALGKSRLKSRDMLVSIPYNGFNHGCDVNSCRVIATFYKQVQRTGP